MAEKGGWLRWLGCVLYASVQLKVGRGLFSVVAHVAVRWQVWLKLPFVGRLAQTAICWQISSNCHWLADGLKLPLVGSLAQVCVFQRQTRFTTKQNRQPLENNTPDTQQKIVFKTSNSRNMTPKTETQKHQMRNPLVCQGWLGHCQSLSGKRWGTTCKKTGEPKHNRNNNHHH